MQNKHKYTTIFSDIHGTLLKDLYSEVPQSWQDCYEQLGPIQLELVDYLNLYDILLVIVSGGNLIETQCMKLTKGLKHKGYICFQNTLHSIDGINWEQNISSLELCEFYLTFPDIKLKLKNYMVSSRFATPLTMELSCNVDEKNKLYEIITQLCEKYTVLHYYVLKQVVSNEKYTCVLMFRSSSMTKTEAIKTWCKKYDIDYNSILFYGNGTNDIDALFNFNSILSSDTQIYPTVLVEDLKKQPLFKGIVNNYCQGLLDFLKNNAI